ncbi:unnamed protein product [Triticum turgidum subsp. durum]|uniref:Pectate lyase n=1 Tax=Triticum turgidum subsp. durum TaxID=4567 RepID=A0A9R0XWB5_TRITD|nr:unnamed protein product [Triticum turgidum subsp. durum]
MAILLFLFFTSILSISYSSPLPVNASGNISARRQAGCGTGNPVDDCWRTGHLSDGDGVSIFGARDVWVDRCTLEDCADGLVDVIAASTGVTVSNCLLTNHNKAMLLGHNDGYEDDRAMRVTVAFNRFGPGLVQRMPRCRFGVFHVVNNDYVNWGKYAIGGSASPTILSRGNRFCAGKKKEVTKRDGDPPKSEWQKWNWISDGDLMFNGAFFTASGGPGAEGASTCKGIKQRLPFRCNETKTNRAAGRRSP